MNGYIVGWNLHGRRGSADLKTEAGGGQEERAKRWWMSSDGWTWRENASARQAHPVSASFLISLRILLLNDRTLSLNPHAWNNMGFHVGKKGHNAGVALMQFKPREQNATAAAAQSKHELAETKREHQFRWQVKQRADGLFFCLFGILEV
jgi:hypothetical protein